jgi:hypothetical protein
MVEGRRAGPLLAPTWPSRTVDRAESHAAGSFRPRVRGTTIGACKLQWRPSL